MRKSHAWSQDFKITKADRSLKKQQQPMCIWFTGLSGSGKSTLIDALEVYLHKKHYHTYVLDGDNLRNGLCDDLSFSNKDRDENLRRASEVARLMVDAGLIVLAGLFLLRLSSEQRSEGYSIKMSLLRFMYQLPWRYANSAILRDFMRKLEQGRLKTFQE